MESVCVLYSFSDASLTVPIGQQTAYQWYAAGCRSLEDLKAGKGGVTLTPAQKIGIEFYDGESISMTQSYGFLTDSVCRY